jgi:fibronectin-binding autotransporter adhesin
MTVSIKFSGKGRPGNLLDPANWVGGVVPGPDSSALITTNVGGPVGGTFSVNNLMLLGAESIAFTGTLNTAGVGDCQGLMICEGATATFAPGAILNDGGVMIVGNDAVGAMVAQGSGTVRSVINTVNANIGKQDGGVGTVTISNATWTNSGHAVIGDDGTGTLNVVNHGIVTFGAGVDMADDTGSNGTMNIAGGGSVTVGTGLCVGGDAPDPFGTASVSVGAGSGLTVDKTLEVGTGSTVGIAGGTVTGGAVADGIKIDAGGVISGFGVLATRAGGPIVDDGTIIASGGTLAVTGNVSGTGALRIAANSAASITGNLGLSGIAFIGRDATLALAAGDKVTSTISGFAIGDVIAMANVDAVSFNAATGVLMLVDHGAKVGSLNFAGSFTGDTFAVSQSAAGALISLQHG